MRKLSDIFKNRRIQMVDTLTAGKVEERVPVENMRNEGMKAYVEKVEKIHKRKKAMVRAMQVLGTLTILVMLGLGKMTYGQAYNTQGMQEGIANEILRFHVLANSDSKEDQALKLKVKQEVVTYLQTLLQDCNSKEESIQLLNSHYQEIEQIAQQVIQKEGYSYGVKMEVAKQYFPVKVYGDLVFPEGEYDALRVLIGKAEGKNWWCVIFPSLCMVNETYSVVPEDSKDTLRHVLTEEEYSTIDAETQDTESKDKETQDKETQDAETQDTSVKVEYDFWIVDLIHNLFS